MYRYDHDMHTQDTLVIGRVYTQSETYRVIHNVNIVVPCLSELIGPWMGSDN